MGYSTHVEKHVESSLAFKDFGQHMFIYTLCSRRYRRGLVITSGDAFGSLAGMGWVWSTRFEINFVSFRPRDGFGQYVLKCILFPRWHGRV